MNNILSFLKKYLVLLLISLLIVGLFCTVSFYHYTSSSSKNDIVSFIENSILDFKFKYRYELRSNEERKPKNKIGILAVDEKSIEQFGRWPFPRKTYVQVLKNLKNKGVKWVAFDSVFSEKERPTVDDAKNIIKNKPLNIISELNKVEKVSPADRSFSEAIKFFSESDEEAEEDNGMGVVLGYFYFLSPREVKEAGREGDAFRGIDKMEESEIALIEPEDLDLDTYDHHKVFGMVSNIDIISQSSPYHAFFSNESDEDAVMRWVTLLRVLDGKLMPSMSLMLASKITGSDIMVEFDNHGVAKLELVKEGEEGEIIYEIPIDPLGRGRLLVDYLGKRQNFRHISLVDAYNNNFNDETREWLKGSSLLFGPTATGINDVKPTPLDSVVDGVEIHAQAVDNIVSKKFMKRPNDIYLWELLALILIGLILTPILIMSRPSLSGLVVVSTILGCLFLDQKLFFSKGVWAYLGMPILEISSLFVVIILYKYFYEEREKKKVKGAFSHYLSPEVISDVLEDPEALALGGKRKELTVFFSDVRSFTTISESLTPEQLCEFMNDYFTPMTNIILQKRGVLDKYIGDAIMAFWGAPINLPDHADRAMDSSVEMLASLKILQEKFKNQGYPACEIGIGLNTGMMSVGNMGSNERFCYTVMGDSVNLGARLEGLTKEYSIKIMASEFTIKSLTKNHHLYRDLDNIRVKGKNEPVRVFHVFSPEDLKGIDAKEFIGNFEEGRKYYSQQKWKEAKKYFEICTKTRPADGPALVYLKRVEEFMNKPYMENWDGVFTFTHK